MNSRDLKWMVDNNPQALVKQIEDAPQIIESKIDSDHQLNWGQHILLFSSNPVLVKACLAKISIEALETFLTKKFDFSTNARKESASYFHFLITNCTEEVNKLILEKLIAERKTIDALLLQRDTNGSTVLYFISKTKKHYLKKFCYEHSPDLIAAPQDKIGFSELHLVLKAPELSPMTFQECIKKLGSKLADEMSRVLPLPGNYYGKTAWHLCVEKIGLAELKILFESVTQLGLDKTDPFFQCSNTTRFSPFEWVATKGSD